MAFQNKEAWDGGGDALRRRQAQTVSVYKFWHERLIQQADAQDSGALTLFRNMGSLVVA